jgi:hypothetical protein
MKKEWIFEEIKVECYAGYKGEEAPRAFTHLGKRFGIVEILDRWYEGNIEATAPRHDFFKVKVEEGEIFLLRYTPRFQMWTLCRHIFAPANSDH